jgi:SpoIID/LytB domain protein
LAAIAPVGIASPAGAAGASPTRAPVATQSFGGLVTILGRGFGHGEGMGQWGAYGYATRFGWSWPAILAHYYGGTALSTVNPNTPISVRLQALDDQPFTAFVQDKGLMSTNANGGATRFRSLVAVETAPGTYAVYGRADTTVCPPAPFNPAGWTLVAPAVASSTAAGTFLDVGVPSVDSNTPDPTNLVGVCQPGGAVVYYRGTLRAVNGPAGENRTVNFVTLEQYVRGVVPREMPASWGTAAGGAGMNALRVQAVAARSFGVAGGLRYPYAKVCDSQSCQVYGGVARRAAVGAPLEAREFATSNQAAADTQGRVLVRSGAVVSAMYSSSTGGLTAGVLFPTVIDVGDDVSPHHRWQVSIPVTTIEAKWPAIGRLRNIDVTRRNGKGEWGGRVQQVVLRGTGGNVTLTGNQFRVGLSLKSDWVYVQPACLGRTGGTPAPAPAAVTFTPVAPARIVDTRDGTNVARERVAAGCVLPVRVAGLGGVPATGATAVVLNVTAVAPTAGGYATIYPCSNGRPNASHLNYRAGDVVPNLVTAALDGDGYLCVFTTAAANFVIDVTGWYGGAGGERFRAVAPARLSDTRAQGGRLAKGAVLSVPVVGGPGAPGGSTVRAVALNVTVTQAVAPGFLTAYPCDSPRPGTSNLNHPWARTVSNQVIIPVGPSNRVCLVATSAAEVIVDLLGWYGPTGASPGSLFTPLPPARVLDTRNAVGVPGRGRVGAGGTIAVGIAGRGGVAAGASAVALNVTAVDTLADGFVTVYPCGIARPGASNLNPSRGRITPNHVLVPVGTAGSVCFATTSATHLLADVAGYFS